MPFLHFRLICNLLCNLFHKNLDKHDCWPAGGLQLYFFIEIKYWIQQHLGGVLLAGVIRPANTRLHAIPKGYKLNQEDMLRPSDCFSFRIILIWLLKQNRPQMHFPPENTEEVKQSSKMELDNMHQ